jgi:hypothetical protein
LNFIYILASIKLYFDYKILLSQTIPKSKFDIEPDEWVNLGATSDNDTVITQTFDELWNMYQNPDTGVTDENSVIIQVRIIATCLSIKIKGKTGALSFIISVIRDIQILLYLGFLLSRIIYLFVTPIFQI